MASKYARRRMRRRMRELLRGMRTTVPIPKTQTTQVVAAGTRRIVSLPSPVQFVDWLLNGEPQQE